MNFIYLLLFIMIDICFSKINSVNFHTLFTFIHNDPCILDNVFGIQIPDYVYNYCDNIEKKNYIHTMENLDYSSFIHIERMIDDNCPFSHNTCYDYCHIYNSCDFFDRIEYYIDDNIEIKRIGEVLMKDNSLDELTAIQGFINSYEHAKIILDKRYNYYGFSHYENIFNINYLETDTILENPDFELKTISIVHNEKTYIFTTEFECDTNNTLIYDNSNMLIYERYKK